MTHSISKPRRRIPRIPFFKDEVAIPGLTTAGAIRLFVIAMLLAIVALAVGGWYLLDYAGKLSEAQKQISDIQKNNHAARLADQQRTDREIRNLQNDTRTTVCSIVALRPPGQSPALDILSKHYRCPPYKRPAPPVSVEVSPAGSTGANGVASVPAVPSSGSPQPSPAPSGSSTPTPTARPSQSPIVNLTSATCPLVGVFC